MSGSKREIVWEQTRDCLRAKERLSENKSKRSNVSVEGNSDEFTSKEVLRTVERSDSELTVCLEVRGDSGFHRHNR